LHRTRHCHALRTVRVAYEVLRTVPAGCILLLPPQDKSHTALVFGSCCFTTLVYHGFTIAVGLIILQGWTT